MAQVTYFGHSCFLVETGGVKLLFDPFITPNELAKEIHLDSISCDYILISHGHADHMADLETFASKPGRTVVSSYEICTWLGKKGLNNSHSMNLGGIWDFGAFTVKMVYAAHSNSLPDGSYGGTAAGYIIKSADACFYYSGDTALTSDMKLIPDSYALDFALLPIGGNYTMHASDAAMAAGYVRCNHVIGMHYDTFPPIRINHQEARAVFEQKGVRLTLMEIGQTLSL